MSNTRPPMPEHDCDIAAISLSSPVPSGRNKETRWPKSVSNEGLQRSWRPMWSGSRQGGLLDQYVNDRACDTSSLMLAAIVRGFGTALGGRSKGRQTPADHGAS